MSSTWNGHVGWIPLLMLLNFSWSIGNAHLHDSSILLPRCDDNVFLMSLNALPASTPPSVHFSPHDLALSDMTNISVDPDCPTYCALKVAVQTQSWELLALIVSGKLSFFSPSDKAIRRAWAKFRPPKL